MKTYNITKRISLQAKNEIRRIVDNHEYYKRSYFWKPASGASSRRSNERKFKLNNPDVAFINGENRIEVTMRYEESARNVYYNLTVKLNNIIKDIRLLKKLIK